MANNFEIRGTIYEIFESVKYSEKFEKQDFVLEIKDGAYTQLIKFQVINERIDQMAKIRVGHDVTVKFNLNGREYQKDGNRTFFTNLTAWYIRRDDGSGDSDRNDNLDDVKILIKEREKKAGFSGNRNGGFDDDLPF